jgi:hypothetical protein
LRCLFCIVNAVACLHCAPACRVCLVQALEKVARSQLPVGLKCPNYRQYVIWTWTTDGDVSICSVGSARQTLFCSLFPSQYKEKEKLTERKYDELQHAREQREQGVEHVPVHACFAVIVLQ